MRNKQDILKDIQARLDSYGLVVQKDGDEGDSAYRTGIYTFLLATLDHSWDSFVQYRNMIKRLQVKPGMFRRTANPQHWGYNPNNLSRDQMNAILLSSAAWDYSKVIEEFKLASHHRDGLLEIPKIGTFLFYLNNIIPFHQNVAPGTDCPPEYRKIPDPVGIGEFRMYIRNGRNWLLYPILTLLDAGYLIDLKLRKKQLWDFDSLLAKELIYTEFSVPTIFSKLAIKLYSKTDYIERIRNNYADKNNGVEPLGELYEYACRKFINKEPGL